MATLAELRLELQPYKDTLVIDGWGDVVRLVDVIDGEDDFYWVFDSRKGIYYASCVGEFIPLKGFIAQDKYDRLLHTWNLNNVEKAM